MAIIGWNCLFNVYIHTYSVVSKTNSGQPPLVSLSDLWCYIAGLGSNTFYQIQIQIHLFSEFQYKYTCTNTMTKMGPNTNTVETRYNTIPYNTISNITRWSHGPQNLQTHIRTLIVLSFIWITLLRVIRWLIAHAVDSEWTHMCGLPLQSNCHSGPITHFKVAWHTMLE